MAMVAAGSLPVAHRIGVRLRNWQLAIDVLNIDVFWFKMMLFSRRSNEYLKNHWRPKLNVLTTGHVPVEA
jgi:hypothetical protein